MVFVAFCATAQSGDVATGNPGKMLNQLGENLTKAKSNQVDVLAPALYKSAHLAYMKAKKALEKGEKLSAINNYVAQGSASLKKAEEIAQVSRTILGDTNKARDKALKVHADRLGKPYMEVQKQYLKLTKAIEKDKLSYAQKNAEKVQAAFRDVEIMAIKNNAIGNARNMMAKAEKAKIRKIAPTAYDQALKALNEADAYIGQNPYEAEGISEKTAHAEFMAWRMMMINEISKKFKAMEPEASALYVENLLMRLSETLKTGDLRDKDVDAQISTLTETVETMGQKLQSLEKDNQMYQKRIASLEQNNQKQIAGLEQMYEKQIEGLEKRLVGLQGYSREQEAAKQKLAAEREFNEQFNKVQRYFRSDEAEVYKQGNQLVIRMRGIQFPVGQSTLAPENYSLLSKVQQAIHTFGKSTVIIEGHTDSTGSAQKNKELSQKRAEAVEAYLLANKTLPKNRIRATGYGPDRPLAPNTTTKGRAINRRIDVLITPFQKP